MNIEVPLPLEVCRQSGFSTPLRLILATTAAFWMGTVQSQAATTTAALPASELRLRHFVHTPEGQNGLQLRDTLRQSDGQTVRLMGYMVQEEQPTPGRFLLASRPAHSSPHAPHHASPLLPPDTVAIYLDPSQQDWAVPHVNGLVTVSGMLNVKVDEAREGVASSVQLHRVPDAKRRMNAFELTGYLHRLPQDPPRRTVTRAA